MHRRALFVLILMCAGVNCYSTEEDESITQFNVTCPARKLGPSIDNYYHECHVRMIRGEPNSCEMFVAVFKELMPEYDCARPVDISGVSKYTVPAIWLLGPAKFSDYHTLIHDLVFEKLYSSSEYAKARKEATELFFSKEFRRILDAGGEVYEDEWNSYEKNMQMNSSP